MTDVRVVLCIQNHSSDCFLYYMYIALYVHPIGTYNYVLSIVILCVSTAPSEACPEQCRE